ncbi:MAG: hypothetical protein QOF66_1871 [Mycobacterium sp.]|jgi:hypothetical protein|uniref:hypothetical protein n=1 Tax=Mycobacterium sp. TaxID=1785 RepID=UPI0028BB11FE|nr:hypothetical protein [Mycobacterium sp.]
MQRLRVGGLGVLFLHEVHKVRGRAEAAFEAAFREGWMPTLGAGDEARLLWYANQAHGSGPAYTVVTVTAVRDGPAWERLAVRIQKGDLRRWVRELDELRHDVEAKLLVPLGWSPLQDVDFNEVPVDGRERELTLYMEDTVWPYEDKFGEYIDRCGEVYSKSLDRPNPLLTIEAAFQPALGSHLRREVTLMQRIHDSGALLKLLQTEIPPEYRRPGTWMHDALELRDDWTSRLLRTSSWSPLH